MESLHVVFVLPVGCVSTPGGKQKKKAGTKIQGDSVEAESSFGELEVPKTDQLTETDPVKTHKGVPREDEPETKKEPGNIHKVESNFLVESVGAESFSGELEVPEKDQLIETDPV